MQNPDSPEFLYRYLPPQDISCTPPDNFREFLDEEKAIRKERYVRLGSELNRLDSLYGKETYDQYHSLPIDGGRRVVYLGRFYHKSKTNKLWHVIVNDEVSNGQFEKQITILDFTLPRTRIPSHINRVETTALRDPSEHRFVIAGNTGPLITAKGGKLKKYQGQNYKTNYTFDHRKDGYVGLMDRVEAANELLGILSLLGDVSYEQGHTFKRS